MILVAILLHGMIQGPEPTVYTITTWTKTGLIHSTYTMRSKAPVIHGNSIVDRYLESLKGFAVLTEDEVLLWNESSARPLAQIPKSFSQAAFEVGEWSISLNAKWAVSASYDRTVRLVELDNGSMRTFPLAKQAKAIGVYSRPSGAASGVGVTEDGENVYISLPSRTRKEFGGAFVPAPELYRLSVRTGRLTYVGNGAPIRVGKDIETALDLDPSSAYRLILWPTKKVVELGEGFATSGSSSRGIVVLEADGEHYIQTIYEKGLRVRSKRIPKGDFIRLPNRMAIK